MQKIFVVVADQGEYSDRDVWNVKAFTRKADAQKYCEEAKQIDVLLSSVEREIRNIVSEITHAWDNENPPLSYNLPKKPQFKYPGLSAKEAQVEHVKAIEKWRLTWTAASNEYAKLNKEWAEKRGIQMIEAEIEASKIVSEENFEISINEIDEWDEVRYSVEEIELNT